jgi:hypothetical protein
LVTFYYFKHFTKKIIGEVDASSFEEAMRVMTCELKLPSKIVRANKGANLASNEESEYLIIVCHVIVVPTKECIAYCKFVQ